VISLLFDENTIRSELEHLLDSKLPEKVGFFAVCSTGGVALIGVGNYNTYDCDLFIGTTGKKPPMREAWKYLKKYVFEICDCTRMTSKVVANNKKALRMNKLFGMTLEGVMRMGDPETGEDIHVFSMLKEEYDGKERKAT
jgi:RimJ/RimL family protein N-acetyltransferase